MSRTLSEIRAMHLTRTPAVVTFVAALAVAGCGADSTGDTDEPEAQAEPGPTGGKFDNADEDTNASKAQLVEALLGASQVRVSKEGPGAGMAYQESIYYPSGQQLPDDYYKTVDEYIFLHFHARTINYHRKEVTLDKDPDGNPRLTFAQYTPPSGGIDKWQVSKDKLTQVPDSDFGTYEWEGNRTDSACDDHPTSAIGHVLTNDHSAGFSKENGDYAAAKKISDDFREATLGKFNDGEPTVGEVLFDTCFRRKETWENRTFTAHYDGDAIVATCTAHDIESMSVLSAKFIYPTPDRNELIVFTLTTTPDE